MLVDVCRAVGGVGPGWGAGLVPVGQCHLCPRSLQPPWVVCGSAEAAGVVRVL